MQNLSKTSAKNARSVRSRDLTTLAVSQALSAIVIFSIVGLIVGFAVLLMLGGV